MSIKPDQLAQTIIKTLEEYEGVTEEAAASGVIMTARAAVEELHNAKPEGAGVYGSWDQYNNSWEAADLTKKKNLYGKVIHNKKHYQLAHLLENGHALAGGGRARAFPHIAPVAEKAEEELLKNIKQLLNK